MTKPRMRTPARKAPAGADAGGTFRALIDVVPGLVVITDAAGRILAFNPACERATGYKRREVLRENLVERFVPPEERRVARECFALAFSSWTNNLFGLAALRSGKNAFNMIRHHFRAKSK